MGKYIKNKSLQIKIKLAVIYVLIIVLAVLITGINQHTKYKKQIDELNAAHEAELVALREELTASYEAEIADLTLYYEYGGDITQIEREAEYISRVVYGTAKNHADSDKRAVVWCILNRVEHYGHPNTIEEVCEQPKQWMGYSKDNPVLEDIYELVLEELKIWYSNDHRPVGNEYLYLSWSSKEILLRDTFEENKSTHYWRMR